MRPAVERGKLQSVKLNEMVRTPPFGPGASPVLRSSPVRRELGKMPQ